MQNLHIEHSLDHPVDIQVVDLLKLKIEQNSLRKIAKKKKIQRKSFIKLLGKKRNKIKKSVEILEKSQGGL